MSEKSYDYEVTFHFVNGTKITGICKNLEMTKDEFIDHITSYDFVGIDESNTININMRNVLYMEVIEKENTDGRNTKL